MQRAEIIAVGTELALGQSIDTNSAWLARELATLGIRCARHTTVPDELDPLRDALVAAGRNHDVVLVTGGLGPTPDDLSRAAAAAAAGVDLVPHAPSRERLEQFFAERGRVLPERNLVQTLFPRGATVLPNTCGTAPGFLVALHDTPVYILPGVPFEMRDMYAREVAPRLRAAATGRVLRTRELHTFGLGESDIATKIADLMERGRNPEIGTTAAHGIITVKINATAGVIGEAELLLDAAERQLTDRLGTIVFGRDGQTLAAAVGEALAAAGATVCTAESCTGGLIGSLLTEISGSSRYYLGGVISYANESKIALLGVDPTLIETHGAVSAPVAREMARGAHQRFNTRYALSVTGIAGPTGGTAQKPVGLVFIGLAGPGGVEVLERRFGTDTPRAGIRIRAAHTALDLLRRSAQGLATD